MKYGVEYEKVNICTCEIRQIRFVLLHEPNLNLVKDCKRQVSFSNEVMIICGFH